MGRATFGIALGSLLQLSAPSQAAGGGVDFARRTNAARYPFCHDLNYVLHRAERSACHYADASSAQCPGLLAACQRPAETDRGAGVLVAAPPENEASSPHGSTGSTLPEPKPLSTPQWPWLKWAIAAASLLLSFVLAIGWLTSARAARSRALRRAPSHQPGSSVGDAEPPLLLQAAREFVAREQHQRAFALTFFALLLELDQRGWVRFSAARTNQEYVRDAAPYPEAQRLLARSSVELDAQRFAGRPVSPERAREFLDAVARFIGRGAGTLIGVWLCLTLTWGCSKPTDATGDGSFPWAALSDQGPNGLSLLASLLEGQQRRVTHHVGAYEDLLERAGTLLVYDQRGVPEVAWDALRRWATGSNQLIIVGPGPGLSHFGQVVHPIHCPEFIPNQELGLRFAPPPAGFVPNSSAAPECSFERFVAQPKDAPGVLLLPTLMMLGNAALLSADNAPLLLPLLGSGSVTFVGRLNVGAGTQSPYDAVAKLQAGPWLVQLTLLLLALYLARGTAFGAPRQPPPAPRRDLLEHVRALGATLARARAGSHALSHYAHLRLDQLQAQLGPGAAQSRAKLTAAIAARTQTPESEVGDLLERVREAREREPDPADAAEALELMRSLHRLIARSRGDRE